MDLIELRSAIDRGMRAMGVEASGVEVALDSGCTLAMVTCSDGCSVLMEMPGDVMDESEGTIHLRHVIPAANVLLFSGLG